MGLVYQLFDRMLEVAFTGRAHWVFEMFNVDLEALNRAAKSVEKHLKIAISRLKSTDQHQPLTLVDLS